MTARAEIERLIAELVHGNDSIHRHHDLDKPTCGYCDLVARYARIVLDRHPELLLQMLAEGAPADEPHLVDFRADGWTMQHPLRCRLGDLFACPYSTAAAAQISGPPSAGPGVYAVELDDADRLTFGATRVAAGPAGEKP